MAKLLTSGWVVALLGTLMYLGTTVALWQAPAGVPKRAAPPPPPKAVLDGPSWDFVNPELDQLMQELRAERTLVAQQKVRLEEWEKRLQVERQELNQVAQSVKKMQTDFDQGVVRVHDEERENLKKLAKVYANMSPEGASLILQELTDDPLVKIMALMKEAETAPVLEAMAKLPGQAKRVATLSERLRLTLYRTNSVRPRMP